MDCNIKFSDMEYIRPDIEKLQAGLSAAIAGLEKAEDYSAARQAFLDFEELNASYGTMMSLANIRYRLNTNDLFYAGELQFFNSVGPQLLAYMQQWKTALYMTRFRPEFTAEFGGMIFLNLENLLHSFSPANIPLSQKESGLKMQYTKLTANIEYAADGHSISRQELNNLKISPDADVREEAFRAEGEAHMGSAKELDAIFDELVKTRDEMGRNMGYPNYTMLAYYQNGRSYTPDQIAVFRKCAAEHIVPVLEKEYRHKAKRLGVSYPLHFSDSYVNFTSGEAKPAGDTQAIIESGREFYHSLSEEAGDFYDMMLDRELFNVASAPGKAPGASTESLIDFEAPFIYANFDGTLGDVQVVIHEAGHAFAGWMNRNRRPLEYIIPTNDAGEINSFGMEFFAESKAELFFGSDAKKYVYGHMLNSLERICYGCAIDEFQHRVYANPEFSPAERNSQWKGLLKIYMPWIDTDYALPYYADGRSWQLQRHIYLYPFYYIDYSLAQTAALQLWNEMRTDRSAAWEKYMRFVRLGGTMPYTELLKAAGFDSPFEEKTIKEICDNAEKWLEVNRFDE